VGQNSKKEGGSFYENACAGKSEERRATGRRPTHSLGSRESEGRLAGKNARRVPKKDKGLPLNGPEVKTSKKSGKKSIEGEEVMDAGRIFLMFPERGGQLI